jgi:Tol biopolymer transport system component
VTPRAGGTPRRLTSLGSYVGGLDWTPDGERIVFSVKTAHAVELQSVPASGGESQHFRTPWPAALNPVAESASVPSRVHRISYARSRPLLAFANSSFDLNIWRLSLPDLTTRRSLIASTFSDSGPAVSQDGRRIAFDSRRSGASEVWVCRDAGDDCAQLTRFGGHSGSPSWSPREHLVAIDARPQGNADIFVADPEGGEPRRLTTHDAEDVVPTFSRDGNQIYFSSDRSGDWEIWRVSLVRGDAPVQITRDGGFSAAESADGRWLFHARIDEEGLWRVPIAGGPSLWVTGDVSCWGYWAVGERGVYLARTALERPQLELLEWDADEPRVLGGLQELRDCGNRGLAISPGDEWLLLARTDLAEGDLLGVEDTP